MTHILLLLIHEIELVKVRHLHPGIGISAFICVSKPGLGLYKIQGKSHNPVK